MINYLLLAFPVFLAISCQAETTTKEPIRDIDRLTAEREAQFYCYKQKICTPGGPKVCGYDPNTPWLAVFEDLCTLYKVNCMRTGRFTLVAQIVCDTKIQYDREHVNDTFEYIHVKPISPIETTRRHRGFQVKLVL